MADNSDQVALALQQKIAADPALKARIAQLSAQIMAPALTLKHHGQLTHELLNAQAAASHELSALTGVPITDAHNHTSDKGTSVGLPKGWMFTATGDVVKDHGLRNELATVAAIVGGGALAGAAGAAAAGSGGAAAGGGSASADALTLGSMGKVGTTAATGLGAWDKYANAGGQILSGIEAGRAAGRNADAQAGRDDQRAVIDAILAGNAQRTSLGNEYDRNVHNVIRGNAISHVQDATFTPPPGVHMGSISGGLKPSLLGGSEVGDPIHAAAMQYLLNPEKPTAVPTPTTPHASGTDSALDWLAPILTGIGNYKKITATPQPLPAPTR